jgi:hypothetical protein
METITCDICGKEKILATDTGGGFMVCNECATRDCKTSKCYNETNNENGYCVDCNNRRAEDRQGRCVVCGDDSDMMVSFTSNGVCGKCTRKAHRKAGGNI